MVCFCTGCASSGSGPGRAQSPEQAETAAALFGDQTGQAAPRADQLEDDWAVVLIAYRGPDAMVAAEQGVIKVNRETRLSARTQVRSAGEVAVVVGRFKSPGDKDAQRTLERVRSTTVDGGTPFARAFLAPPPLAGAVPVTGDPMDLRNAVKRAPGALYTLEVAVYAMPDGSEPTASELKQFRDAAVKAAREFRAEGDEAYYYHGPSSSSVTIGLFGEADHDPGDPLAESDPLRKARLKHPNLLVNGAGQRRKLKLANGMETYELDPSRLVGVPR